MRLRVRLSGTFIIVPLLRKDSAEMNAIQTSTIDRNWNLVLFLNSSFMRSVEEELIPDKINKVKVVNLYTEFFVHKKNGKSINVKWY